MSVELTEAARRVPARVNGRAGTASDCMAMVRRLARDFGGRAAAYDATGDFVAENYREMKAARLFSAGVPAELGGGGASHSELATIALELGRHDGSTALAWAMHAHPLSVRVFDHLKGDPSASGTLRRVAEDELVLASTGVSDWLGSSGTAERLEDGFVVRAEKPYVSGSAGADLLVSSARHDGPDGAEVVHFSAPFASPHIRVVEGRSGHGMRGTGAHHVVIDGLFVPDASVELRRPADVWHPTWNATLPLALPLVVAAYVGLAEAAVALATESARAAGVRPVSEVGSMLTQLALARMALTDMLRLVADYDFEPTPALADATLRRKAIATDAVQAVVEHAADLVGAHGFVRGHPFERIVRDVRGMRFHPLPERRQRDLTGRLALGLKPV